MRDHDQHAPTDNRTAAMFGTAAADREMEPTRPAGDDEPTRRAVSDRIAEGAGGTAGAGVEAWAESESDSPPMPTRIVPGMLLLGKYRVDRKLGEGGMGSVWLVHHLRLDEPRALKFIGEGISQDPEARARFEREARILAKLKHPNSVTVHDTGIVGDSAYIEMEFVQGENLRHRLRRDQPTPPPFILWVMRGICDVLGYAHHKGIVHRDLKPENVMIVVDPDTGRPGVKVVDFGIAKLVKPDDSGQSQTMATQGVLGTIAYCSPEQNHFDDQTRVRAPIDHRGDVYSLGVMLYEMLTGELPFRGAWAQVLYDHAKLAPRPPREVAPDAEIPAAVEALVLRCLEKSPELRPSSAAELYNELQAAFGEAVAMRSTLGADQPTPGRSPLEVLTPHSHGSVAPTRAATAPVEPPTRRRLRRIAIPAAAAVVVVAAAAVGLAVYNRGGGEPTPVTDSSLKASPLERPTGPSRAVVDYLKTYHPRRPYEPAAGAELVKLDGLWWPEAVSTVDPDDRRRLELRGRIYLPAAAVVDEGEGTEGPYKLPLSVRVGEGAARIVFRLVPGGSFVMGDSDPNRKDPDANPHHEVVMSPYYVQETETTVAQFMPFRRGADRATGEDFRDFDEDASARERAGEDGVFPAVWLPRRACAAFAASIGARLPTEAQWEFAARSGGRRTGDYVWNDPAAVPANMANVGFAHLDPRLMGAKSFNDDRTMGGIFDMAGNAREWCRDVHRPYLDSKIPLVDPFEAPREGEADPAFSIRGGSFLTPDESARVWFRADLPDLEYKAKDSKGFEDVGFRTVLEVAVAPRLDDRGRPADAPAPEASP